MHAHKQNDMHGFPWCSIKYQHKLCCYALSFWINCTELIWGVDDNTIVFTPFDIYVFPWFSIKYLEVTRCYASSCWINCTEFVITIQLQSQLYQVLHSLHKLDSKFWVSCVWNLYPWLTRKVQEHKQFQLQTIADILCTG